MPVFDDDEAALPVAVFYLGFLFTGLRG